MRGTSTLSALCMMCLWGTFLVYLGSCAVDLFGFAYQSDQRSNQTVSTLGDAHGYQKMAVNILHGLGPADSESLPLAEYKLDLTTPWGLAAVKYEQESGVRAVNNHFDRPPGFPMMMAATYYVFGVETVYARYLLASCVLLGALFLAIGGYFVSPRWGALAGMATSVLYLRSVQSSWFDGILTEIPASFWASSFFVFFSIYERGSHRLATWLALSALSLTMFIFTRFNFFTVIPLMVVYLAWRRAKVAHIALFIGITCIPLAIWSSYASSQLGKFTFLSTQGSGLFSTSNNIDSVHGIGSDGWNRGGWNPGWIKAADGSLSCDYRHLPPDGTGWKRGLAFWKEHLTDLPRLFYYKAEKGLWFNDGIVTSPTKPEGFQLLAICLLLLALGQQTKVNDSTGTTRIGWRSLAQVVLITCCVAVWNQAPFYWILAIWGGILALSLLRRLSAASPLLIPIPIWVGSLALSHLVSTVVFYGSWRFHQPFDLLMLFVAFYGLIATVVALYQRSRLVGAVVALAWVSLIARRFDLL